MSEHYGQPIVYLNKKYLPLNEARVSVMDRGFLMADGIYEVIPIYNSKPFAAHDHYQRLLQSLTQVHITPILSYEDFLDIINTLINRNQRLPIQNCYFQITRGVSASRQQLDPDMIPTIFARLETPKHICATGIKVITVEDIRWARCDIKGINKLHDVLMRQQVAIAQADDGIIVNNGYAMEGLSSNLFIVEEQTVITPPLSKNLLSGVTRKIVIDLVRNHGYKCLEESIPLNRLFSADEVWLTSSVIEVAMVSQVNEKKITNEANLIGTIIGQAYSKYINHLIETAS